MKMTIVHFGGTEKVVEFEDILANGWVQVRYPNGAGCYRFALAHGNIEAARGVQPEWRLSDLDLAAMRALAAERKIKVRKQRAPGRPRAPKKRAPSKQVDLFE